MPASWTSPNQTGCRPSAVFRGGAGRLITLRLSSNRFSDRISLVKHSCAAHAAPCCAASLRIGLTSSASRSAVQHPDLRRCVVYDALTSHVSGFIEYMNHWARKQVYSNWAQLLAGAHLPIDWHPISDPASLPPATSAPPVVSCTRAAELTCRAHGGACGSGGRCSGAQPRLPQRRRQRRLPPPCACFKVSLPKST